MRRTIRKGRAGILLGAAALLGVGTVAGHEFQYRRQASLLLNQADDLAKQKNYPLALQQYQQYLNLRPKDAEAMGRYTDLLEVVSTGKPREQMRLIDSYERLLLIDNESPRYSERNKLIELYMKYGFYSNAKVHLRTLETAEDKSFRNDATLWERLAKCALGENTIRNRDEAIGYFRKAIECTGKPAPPEVFHDLANLLRYDIKTKESIVEADRVIDELVALRPDDAKARLVRAKYRIASGQAAKAKDDVDFIRQKGSGGDAEVILAVANIDILDKKLDQARRSLKDGVKQFPKDVRFNLALTNVLLELGESKEAAEQLKACVAGLRPDAPMYFLAVDKLLDLGEVKPAEEAAKQYAASEETQPQSDFFRARLALQSGDWAVATGYAESCAKPIARLPGMAARGHFLLAQCQLLAGNPDTALQHATAALRVDPSLLPARLLQAEAYERLGQFSLAADAYKDVAVVAPVAKVGRAKAMLIEQLRKDPRDRNWREFDLELNGPQTSAELETLRIDAMLARGRTPEALAAVETSLNKDPKQPPLQVMLSEIRANTINPAAGMVTLDTAEKTCGDRPEFRIARARLLAKDPGTADPRAIAALGTNLDSYSAVDKHRTLMALGETLMRLKKSAAAKPLFRQAADVLPTDVRSRLALFDLACEAGTWADAEAVAEEFKAIEGADGPTYIVCKATAALPTLDRKSPAAIIEWRRKVDAVRPRKDSWDRLHACLGDLNDLLGNDDAAVEHYVKAIELGDRNALLIRKTYFKLTQRRQFEQANAILSKASSSTEYARWGAAWSVATKDPRSALTMIDPESKSPSDQVLRAQLLVLSGKPADAEPVFRKALSLSDGKNAEIWLAFVRYLVSTQQSLTAKRAVEEAESALKPQLASDSAAAVALALGQCREALGEVESAETWFRQAIGANRDSYQAVSELANLYQRTNRRTDAEKLLSDHLAKNPGEIARRQFRRQLAISKVSHAAGYQSVPEAVSLIEQNITEANQIEDIRTKALVLAVDPFRVGEAKQLLLDTAQRFPLTANENVLLAQLYINERDFENAEASLVAATRTTQVQPEHLALLVRVRVQLEKMSEAAETVEKLKLISPVNWLTVTEDARLLAKRGKKSEAVAKLMELPQAKDPVSSARSVAPLLEEFGCPAEAEREFRRAFVESKAPNRHTYLAGFLLRQGKPLAALELAISCVDMIDLPTGITARIMTGAVHSRKPDDADPAWQPAIAKVETFVKAQVAKDPRNPDLRYAEAELADAQGRYDDAIKAYEAALSIVPGHPVYVNNLCFLLAVHSRDGSSRTLGLIDEVIRTRGPDATRLDTRAMVHLAAGRADDALKDLALALQLKPSVAYGFHQALAFEKAGNLTRRDTTFRLALLDKLTKDSLHPREWADFDRLNAPPKKTGPGSSAGPVPGPK